MTSGTKTVDFRNSVSGVFATCFESGAAWVKAGTYSKKTWSGSDSPKAVYPDQSLVDFSYPKYNKQGQFVREVKRVRLVPSRSALRKKSFRENPYQCTLEFRGDCIGWSSVYCGTSTPLKGWQITTRDSTSRSADWQVLPVTNQELLAIYGKLRHRIGAEFNASVALGESRDTLRMITGTATKLYQAYRHARRGRWKSAANTLVGARGRTRSFTDRKNFADNWLQLRYGWLPLLGDIHSGVRHLAEVMNRPKTMVHRVTAKRVDPGPKPDGVYDGNRTTRLQVVAKISSVNELALAGLTSPWSLAWELLPFSFVADWFIPVGNTLDALALRGAITAKYITTESIANLRTGYYAKDTSWKYAQPMDLRFIKVNRTVSTSLPSLKPPSKADLSVDLDVKKAITAVSLIIQRMR